MVEIEIRCRIPIWRTFEGIEWHVIPQLRVTLQGAGTWWIHCHDSRATCHTAGCSHLAKSMSRSCHIAGCRKISSAIIENRYSPYFLFLMQFRLWGAAAFVSSPIHVLLNVSGDDAQTLRGRKCRVLASATKTEPVSVTRYSAECRALLYCGRSVHGAAMLR